jgi:hypothetical protein
MRPKSLLHKTNGHRHLPQSAAPSEGEVLGLVHSDEAAASELSADDLRFARVVHTECAPASGAVDALPVSLARSLAETRERMDRGELSDIQGGLAALQDQAAVADRVVHRLLGATTDRVAAQPRRPALVDVNALVTRTLERLADHGLGAPPVTPRLVAAPRPIVGDFEGLQDVLLILMVSIGPVMAAAGRPGTIEVETVQEPGVLRGEAIVRIRVRHTPRPGGTPLAAGPLAAAEDDETPLRVVARALGQHGGALSTVRLPDGGVQFTLEFPAV